MQQKPSKQRKKSTTNYVWNNCKILKNKWAKVTATNFTGNLQNNEKIKIALDKIAPPWAVTDPAYLPDCNANEFFDTHFNFYEFNSALNSKKKH